MVKSNGPEMVAALWAMTGISLFFIGLRFFCKGIYSRQMRTDDAVLLFAWALTLIYTSLITRSVSYGLGNPGASIPPENIVPMYRYMFLGEIFTLLAIPISKTSFAITLLRLISKPWQRIFVLFVIISMNVVMWLVWILLLVQCRPIAKNWDKDLEGTCWDSDVQDRYSIFAGIYSALLDILLSTFPCLIIWKLQISTREKLGVVVCMSLGFLAGIAALIKTTYLPGLGNFTDMSYQITDLLIWSNAETAVTILAASIPFFRVLIRNVTSRGTGERGGRAEMYEFDASRSYRLGSWSGTVGTDAGGGEAGGRRGVVGIREIEVVGGGFNGRGHGNVRDMGVYAGAGDDEYDDGSESGSGRTLPIQGIVKREEVRVEYLGESGKGG